MIRHEPPAKLHGPAVVKIFSPILSRGRPSERYAFRTLTFGTSTYEATFSRAKKRTVARWDSLKGT
jgi:hypothetical protein